MTTLVMILALFFVAPVAGIVALCMAAGLRRFRLWPQGISEFLGTVILFWTTLGSALLILTLDAFVTHPARLQRELVGRQVASIFTLRRYEAGGFQDPYQSWTYQLSAEDAAELQQLCASVTRMRLSTQCWFRDRQDDRYVGAASIKGNVLHVQEGLW